MVRAAQHICIYIFLLVNPVWRGRAAQVIRRPMNGLATYACAFSLVGDIPDVTCVP